MFRRLVIPIILSFALIVVYAQVVGFDFLRFDDPDYTFANQFVKDGLSMANVRRAFTDFRHGAVWMPVTWLTYMADITFFGKGACSHHMVNLILHMANSLLLLKLCFVVRGGRCGEDGRQGGDRPKTACGIWDNGWLLVASVAFWALHPQRVEAVAWIASRKELLWAFFTLAGLIAWWRARYWIASVSCAFACMSKPTAMVFPLLALALDCMQGRIVLSLNLDALKSSKIKGVSRPLAVSGWASTGMRCLPLIVMAMATGAAAMYSQTHPEGMAVKDLFYAGFFKRMLDAAVAVGLYLWQMIVPVGIHLDYRAVPGGWPLDGMLGLVVLTMALAGVACYACRSFRTSTGKLSAGTVSMTVFWFLVALAPTLGIFGSFGEHARADRFLYVPAMALPMALALWRWRGENRWLKACVFVFIALLAVQTWRIASTYRNDTAVFERALACDPDHGRALAHVGEARCVAGNFNEGIELLRHSRRVRPREATDGKLAYALMSRGRAEDWREIREVCAPFAVDPSRDSKGQALEALGTAELLAHEWKSAAKHLSRSIIAPARFYSAADVKLKLAYAWHNGGRRADARTLFEVISRSTRADLSARAKQALEITSHSPSAILFW